MAVVRFVWRENMAQIGVDKIAIAMLLYHCRRPGRHVAERLHTSHMASVKIKRVQSKSKKASYHIGAFLHGMVVGKLFASTPMSTSAIFTKKIACLVFEPWVKRI